MSAIIHPSEAGHWYDIYGAPRYTVIGKNGKERATTIRDAREHGWLPSVTSICRLAAAPGLQAWKERQVVLAALTHPGLTGTDADVELILADAAEQAKKAREAGTMVHAALQSAYEDKPFAEEYLPHYLGTSYALKEWSGNIAWVAERSFAEPFLGYGGKCDLSSPTHVADFKSTDKPLDGLRAWDEHAHQLAAYRYGLGYPQAKCAIVYVHIVTGEARVIEVPEEELARGWDCFQALLAFWKAKTRKL